MLWTTLPPLAVWAAAANILIFHATHIMQTQCHLWLQASFLFLAAKMCVSLISEVFNKEGNCFDNAFRLLLSLRIFLSASGPCTWFQLRLIPIFVIPKFKMYPLCKLDISLLISLEGSCQHTLEKKKRTNSRESRHHGSSAKHKPERIRYQSCNIIGYVWKVVHLSKNRE